LNTSGADWTKSTALGFHAKITASNQIMLGTNTENVEIPGSLNVTGTVSGITKTMIGLSNVDNTSDIGKPVSTAQQTAISLKANLASPTFTGTVSGITPTMIGLSNVENTSDTGKPVSTAQQTAFNLKANLASPTFTGTVSGITKTMVDLANVENTSDTGKPVSTAQQTAFNLKANLASPTFTGTVSGITTTMIGLSNVDNTSDTGKPVSTAQQTAISLKANLASPMFTTDITVNDITIGKGLGNILNNTAIGINALSSNINGSQNTATGYNALNQNSTGNGNTAYGSNVLVSNTTGSNNIGIGGYRTLQFNITGGHNVGVGLNTLRDGTTGNGNIGIGYSAGWNLYAGSNYNTLLGYGSKFLSGSTVYTGSTAIGNSAVITASSQVVLGSTITNVYVPYHLGIGTASPEAALHVASGVNMTTYLDTTGRYLSYNSTSIGQHDFSDGVYKMSIYADDAIFSELYVIASDRRMKTKIVDVPDNLALQQVRDIPCRYYEYIDKVNKGNTNVVGFIAQEVKEVLPSAIKLVKRYIPDEYRILEGVSWEEIGDVSSNITYKMSSDLTDVSGVKYKFMVGNDLSENEIEEKIVGNSDNTFTFDASYQYVFCYGKQVDDFHSIDKNQIFALHHSAIQEIDRLQLEGKEKTTTLETKVTELETKNAVLQTQLNNIMTILNNNNLS